MTTLRSLISHIADSIDWNTSHYIATSIILPLEGDNAYHFSTRNEEDMRNEIYVCLGDRCSVVKKGNIRTVYCCLPREFVTPEMTKYRDPADPSMYKFWLPERMFNSILRDHPVDVDAMVEAAHMHYASCGYEWDDPAAYDAKIKEWLY